MRVLAKSCKTASICTRKTARTAVSLPVLAWQNLFVPSGRKAAGASKALPRRISRVFEYFSPNRVYANSRNSTRNRAISRVPARRYAISWVSARFALSHTISRKCNQQFRSGMAMVLIIQGIANKCLVCLLFKECRSYQCYYVPSIVRPHSTI